MKKKLLTGLAMLVCILGLTGCGQEMTENSFITKDEAKQIGENLGGWLGDNLQNADTTGMDKDSYLSQYTMMAQMQGYEEEDYAFEMGLLESGFDAAEEFGSFVSVLSDETEVTITEDKADVRIKLQGDRVYKGNKQRTATMEVVMTEKGFDSVTISPDYDMSELMTKAALNTVLGMGTVFAVLILISILISSFNLIPKIQKKFQKKPELEETSQAAVQTAPVTTVKEEDDTELIAVIAAAIAASEGAASADGYVVRSIFRR